MNILSIIVLFLSQFILYHQIIVCDTYGGEALYNILAGFILRDLGYIIFPEGILDRLLNIDGAPDMIAIKIPEIENGAWFAEFELKPSDIKYELKEIDNSQAIVLEGKSESTSGSKGYRQLESYLELGYFNFGMLVCPGRISDEKYYPKYGYITWDNEEKEYKYFL